MFIKRNRTQHAGKPYQSVLLVQGKRVPAKRAPGRPAAGAAPPKSVVVHETLANLSRLPAELIGLIESYCQESVPTATATPATRAAASAGAPALHVGPCYGLLAGLHALARELGIVRTVGAATRPQRLALYLIYARLAHQGSRLSAARASEDHAVCEVLQVGAFDEDDLYAALNYLAAHQREIETALAPKATPGAVFLYDVTSVYFEGQHNELAAFGYNRDGKRGKQQMVAGLLTDGAGEPLSIQLYAGNTSDPPPFLAAVEQLKVRFGTEEIAVVGDRGMIKALGQAALGARTANGSQHHVPVPLRSTVITRFPATTRTLTPTGSFAASRGSLIHVTRTSKHSVSNHLRLSTRRAPLPQRWPLYFVRASPCRSQARQNRRPNRVHLSPCIETRYGLFVHFQLLSTRGSRPSAVTFRYWPFSVGQVRDYHPAVQVRSQAQERTRPRVRPSCASQPDDARPRALNQARRRVRSPLQKK